MLIAANLKQPTVYMYKLNQVVDFNPICIVFSALCNPKCYSVNICQG